MTIANFVPNIWSAKLNESLKKDLVFGNVVNTDYEGDIAGQGSTVKINTVGAITIGDYDKETGLAAPEQVTSTQTTLTIDQAKSFNFSVEDIDTAQANVNVLGGAMGEASYGLADVMDKFIASFYTEVAAGNTIGTDEAPIAVAVTDAYDYLVDLGVLLSEADVPKNDRWVVVPEFYLGLINKDPRFTKDSNVISGGYIGNVNGMNVYASNNAPKVGENYKVIAGHRSAISFAQQIDKIEAYRPEGRFSDAVKGLQLYGAKVIRPSALAVLTVSK